MMAHIDLCSGIGGFAYAFETIELSKPVLFCEPDKFCQKVLKKHWPDVPIVNDVKELAHDPARIISAIKGRQFILSAGYPCQPFSVAGKQRGFEDDRHIWSEIFSIIQKTNPTWIICENVPGHIEMGLNEVLSDLADKAYYEVQTFCIGAISQNAPHRRQRVFIVGTNMADTKSKGLQRTPSHSLSQKKQSGLFDNQKEIRSTIRSNSARCSELRTQNLADSNNARNRASEHKTEQNRQTANEGRQEQPQSEFSRQRNNVADSQSLYSDDGKFRQQSKRQEPKFRNSSSTTDNRQTTNNTTQQRMGDLADGLSKGLSGRFGRHSGFEVEPADIPRVTTKVKDNKQKLMALGNSIVPQVVMQLGLCIKENL